MEESLNNVNSCLELIKYLIENPDLAAGERLRYVYSLEQCEEIMFIYTDLIRSNIIKSGKML